jgi:hypothetical protein
MIHLRIESPGGRVAPACRAGWNKPSTPNLAKVTCRECKMRGEELQAQLKAAEAAIRG